uniref:protein-tyrosine-phosphatase n=1 Tax=Syphacia muris TaxID=451379 RepID=A0A0N5AGB8_9BILA
LLVFRISHYFYPISGIEAERILLKYAKVGQFFIRPSESTPGDYTLSILHKEGKPLNARISKVPNGYRFYGKEVFPNLLELVYHCIKNPRQLKEKNGDFVYFRGPLEIPPNEKIGFYLTCARYERIFHASISGLEAEEILKHDGKIGSYLVRESLSSPGTFVISVRSTDDRITHIKLYFDVGDKDAQGCFYVTSQIKYLGLGPLLYRYKTLPMVIEGVEYPTVRLKDKLQSHPSQFEPLRCFAGKSEENINKNRYKNIVANDRTRVYLETEPPPGHSDYINANYVKVCPDRYPEYAGLKKLYICTQGCLPNTVDDFWEMVWQQNSRIVVMITKEVEKEKNKCCHYWPNPEKSFNTGWNKKYSIRNLGEEQKRDFIFRTFELKDNESEIVRTVYHFQYVTWPDHGCPNNPLDLINFRNEIRNCEFECRQGAAWGPWIVHCSAGIGRSGVFLVIDIMTEHISRIVAQKAVDSSLCYVNVFRTVLMLRDQRAGIIQSDLQYRFIYQALNVYLLKFHPELSNKGQARVETFVEKCPRRIDVYERSPERSEDEVESDSASSPSFSAEERGHIYINDFNQTCVFPENNYKNSKIKGGKDDEVIVAELEPPQLYDWDANDDENSTASGSDRQPWSLLEEPRKLLSKYSRGEPPFILPRSDDPLPDL